MNVEWQNDLERWLEPFLKGLGNKTRRRMCPAYIAGLIGPGDRKSIQPMAARGDAISYDRLHHFIGAGVWDSGPLESALLHQADNLVGGEKAWLIIDDTALPKKGNASVGVAPQYASALGNNANCQTLVSVTLASGEVPLMLSLRLFLPESWTSDEARMIKAGVPERFRQARTKPELAIEEIDQIAAAGVRFGCILADAGYGLSAPFRKALSTRGLCWTVGIPRHQKVYLADVQLILRVAGRGRDGGARYQRRYDRQHGGPGASLRRRAKKGDQEAQRLGRYRGGFTTKLHARCDRHGRPLGCALTPGQTHDVQGFGPLFRMLGDRIEALLADKGYDADASGRSHGDDGRDDLVESPDPRLCRRSLNSLRHPALT